MISITFQAVQNIMRHRHIYILDKVDVSRWENGGGVFGPSGFRLAGTGVTLTSLAVLMPF
jgi:hypothetical protein